MMEPGGAVVVLPPPVAAPAAGAAARVPWSPPRARLALATALFVLGCAAAALAFFAVTTLPRAHDSRLLGTCAPTDEEAADLRAASEKLLLAASSQVLAGTAALLLPAWPVADFGCVLGWFTSYHATDVLWMLVACHDEAHGWLAFHFWVFFVLRLLVLVIGVVVSIIG